MIKYFCDECGKETKRNYVANRLKPVLFADPERSWELEIMVTYNSCANDGVLCLKCLQKIVTDCREK